MRWIDLPPIAEFEDRSGLVRRLYGPSVLGRFAFSDRLRQIGELLGDVDMPWPELYRSSAQFRAAINGALECWGLSVDCLSESQVEALLLYRSVDGHPKGGILAELLESPVEINGEPQSLAETLAALATHCDSLMEAMEVASGIPADLLGEVLKSKAEKQDGKTSKQQRDRESFIKSNFDNLMAGFDGQ